MPRAHQAPSDKTVLELIELDPFEEMVSTLCDPIFGHGCFVFKLAMMFLLPNVDSTGQPFHLYRHC